MHKRWKPDWVATLLMGKPGGRDTDRAVDAACASQKHRSFLKTYSKLLFEHLTSPHRRRREKRKTPRSPNRASLAAIRLP